MFDRARELFPFAIAVVLPPAGLMLGLAAIGDDRDLGMRLIAVSVLAAVIWVLLVL